MDNFFISMMKRFRYDTTINYSMNTPGWFSKGITPAKMQ